MRANTYAHYWQVVGEAHDDAARAIHAAAHDIDILEEDHLRADLELEAPSRGARAVHQFNERRSVGRIERLKHVRLAGQRAQALGVDGVGAVIVRVKLRRRDAVAVDGVAGGGLQRALGGGRAAALAELGEHGDKTRVGLAKDGPQDDNAQVSGLPGGRLEAEHRRVARHGRKLEKVPAQDELHTAKWSVAAARKARQSVHQIKQSAVEH